MSAQEPVEPGQPERPSRTERPDPPNWPDEARLLPWRRADGGPCYLVGDGTGRVSRLADSIEAIQLGMAEELLEHADDMVADRRVTFAQVLFLATRLTETLRDVHRIATSRGARAGGTQARRSPRG